MMKKIGTFLGAAFAGALLLIGVAMTPAKASTYAFNFDGAVYDVIGTLTTNALDQVTALSGTMTGPQGGAFSAAIPTGTAPWTSTWSWDNLFVAIPPQVTNGGILWQNADLSIANLYSVGSQIFLSVANPDIGFYNPGDLGTLTAAPVPLPAALPLLAGALGGFGLFSRKKRKQVPNDIAGLVPA